jgi:ankyrin repeat protein
MGFNLDEPKTNGITALGIAAYRSNLHMMDKLVKGGADPKFVNRSGIGALYLAVKGDQRDAVSYLLQLHVPIYYENCDNSPVFLAVKKNRIEIIEQFCDRYEAQSF